MSPGAPALKSPASTPALMVKPGPPVIVGATKGSGSGSVNGTDINRYQGSSEPGAPNLYIPNVSPATAIVSPLAPGVLQAAAVAGGGQKPTFAKAEIEAARNTSSSVSLRVTLSSFYIPSQK